MIVPKYFTIFCFFFFISRSNGSKTVQTITHKLNKTKTVIETTSFGSGGGITGSGPDFVKTKLRQYDSLNTLIYESYKETSYSGCMANTEKWEVTATSKDGNVKELELVNDDKLKITYRNKNHQIDSVVTIRYSDYNRIGWLNQNDE
jgi:hypothetical protein